MAAERKREEDQHTAERTAERAEELRKILGELESASDPAEVARLLREGGVSAEHCLDPWDRLAASGALGRPDYELVRVKVNYRRLFGNAAREESRIGAWRYRAPLKLEKEWQLIDEDGTLWDEDGDLPGISKYTVLPRMGDYKAGEQFVAVTCGSEVVMKVRRGAPGWTLEGGRPMHRHAERAGERFPAAVLGAIEFLDQEDSS